MKSAPTIVLFSGLGADRRLFSKQLAAIPTLQVLDWIEPRDGEDLPTYARRFAATLPSARPLVLGGCSFGGFVAWELSQHVKPEALLLISSTSSLDNIRRPLRSALPTAPMLPAASAQVLKFTAPLAAPLFGVSEAADVRLFIEMLRATPPRFITWATGALAKWRPTTISVTTKVHRIHGSRDRIIRPSSDAQVIEGGHLLPMTSAQEVTTFIERAIASVS